MKLHEHRCTSNNFCTRTHAYKCKIPTCGAWYRTNGDTQWTTLVKEYIFPFYPYCSWECFTQDAPPNDSRRFEADIVFSDFRIEFPDNTAHTAFGYLMTQTKEL